MSSENPTNSVELVALRRQYGSHAAVDSIDLDIRRGEFFSLIGPSGCGKTTTLRLLAGLETPTSGQIVLDGTDVAAVPPYKRNVHTVFQNYGLFPHLDVAGNVAFGLKEKKASRRDIKKKVADMLELVGLHDKASMKPASLSGGMQQRVALARALVLEPEVLLLDEPLGALDLKLRRQMQELLKRIQREVGITFVYVTHDQEEAFSMSDRVGIMSGGQLQQVGTPADVYYRPLNSFVATFVGSSNLVRGRIAEVTEAGLYKVESDALGAMEIAGIPGMKSGKVIDLLVRPEFVQLATERSSTKAEGTVTAYSFQGNHSRLTVELDNGLGELKSDLFGVLAEFRYQVGDRVALDVPPEHVWALPADGGPAIDAEEMNA